MYFAVSERPSRSSPPSASHQISSQVEKVGASSTGKKPHWAGLQLCTCVCVCVCVCVLCVSVCVCVCACVNACMHTILHKHYSACSPIIISVVCVVLDRIK